MELGTSAVVDESFASNTVATRCNSSALRASRQQLLHTNRRNARRRMRSEPARVAATGRVADDIDEILHGEAQAAKWTVFGRWQREDLDESAGLFDGNGLH